MEEMKEENKDNKENQGEANDKVSKRFEQNLSKLVALFNGKEAFSKDKIKNSDVNEVVQELLKEKKEGFIKTFKEKATKLLTSKVEFDKFCEQKKKELDQAIINKKKEFNNEMEECFKLVENIDNLQKDYAKTFENLSNKSE